MRWPMLKIMIKQENQKPRTIRLPYLLIDMGLRLATTKLFWKVINSTKRQNQEQEEHQWLLLEQIDWQDIQPILKEIKNYKGMTILDVQDKNGQAVKVEL
ncbi:hypothetical protein ACA30_09720 [Virgibacillus soli]|uniref:Uncharacterized protein n=2 Tax=Lederbergia galactosidilytica TaxID=217031 RepID=A0A178A0Z1_9BACI|nr:hypothetical protein ACA30_09720 [Virgibacillus soli]OAK73845.1 hypothetical protein ABB05_05250 [Lederbergia galactosidilytica]